MDRLRPAWNSLYSASNATVFQSFDWNRLAAQVFGDRAQPFVVSVESDSGMAIIPAAVVQGKRVELLGDVLFDYRDFLHAGSRSVLRAAVQKIAELKLPLSVTAIRGDRSVAWEPLKPVPFCNAPVVRRAEMSPDEFAAEHTRLARNFRRLARERVVLTQYMGDHASLLEWIYRSKAEQFAGSTEPIFDDRQRIDFMLRAGAMDPHALEIFTFEAGSKTVAALVTIRDRGVRRFYTVWFDPAWDKHSPGVVLVFAITQRSLAEGLDCDYMTGEQSHKTRLAAGTIPLHRVDASEEDLARVVELADAVAHEPELAA